MSNEHSNKSVVGAVIWMCLASWGLYGLLIVANQYFDIFDIRSITGRSIYAFARIMPGIVAYIAMVLSGKINGFKDFMKGYVKCKGKVRGFLIIYMFFVIQITASVMLGRVSQIYFYEFVLDAILLVPVVLAEEGAFRYYLLEDIQQNMPSFIGFCVVGMIQGLMYLPLWFIDGSVQGKTSFGIYLTMIIFIGILLGFIKNITGSALICGICGYLMYMLMEIFDGIIFENPRINIFYIAEVILFTVLYLVLQKSGNKITEDV